MNEDKKMLVDVFTVQRSNQYVDQEVDQKEYQIKYVCKSDSLLCTLIRHYY